MPVGCVVKGHNIYSVIFAYAARCAVNVNEPGENFVCRFSIHGLIHRSLEIQMDIADKALAVFA